MSELSPYKTKINKSIEPSLLFALCCFGVAIVGLGFVASVANIDIVLLVFTLAFNGWLVLRQRHVFVKYMYLHIMACWSIVDVYMLENMSIWMPNLQLYSWHQGSLFWLVFSEYVFVAALCYFEKPYDRCKVHTGASLGYSLKYTPGKWTITLLYLLGLILMAAVVEAVFTGYYAGQYSSRFEYINNSTTISYGLRDYFFMLLPLAIIVSFGGKNSGFAYFYLGCYVVFQFLIGSKFGPLFLAVWVFALVRIYAACKTGEDQNVLVSRVLGIFAILGAILLVYSLIQMSVEHGSFNLGLEQFFNRLANGQGDVWWGIYSNQLNEPPHIAELWDELSGLNHVSGDQRAYNFGIYKMMNLIAPDSVLQRYAIRNSRFAASTNASLYYYFGAFGLIAGRIFIAWMLSRVVNGLLDHCRQGRLFDAFIYMALLRYALEVESMSAFYLLLSGKFLICVVALLMLRAFRERVDCYCGSIPVSLRTYECDSAV